MSRSVSECVCLQGRPTDRRRACAHLAQPSLHPFIYIWALCTYLQVKKNKLWSRINIDTKNTNIRTVQQSVTKRQTDCIQHDSLSPSSKSADGYMITSWSVSPFFSPNKTCSRVSLTVSSETEQRSERTNSTSQREQHRRCADTHTHTCAWRECTTATDWCQGLSNDWPSGREFLTWSCRKVHAMWIQQHSVSGLCAKQYRPFLFDSNMRQKSLETKRVSAWSWSSRKPIKTCNGEKTRSESQDEGNSAEAPLTGPKESMNTT